jgi:hypothetical protein
MLKGRFLCQAGERLCVWRYFLNNCVEMSQHNNSWATYALMVNCMTSENRHIYDPDELIDSFAQRHGILKTQMVQRESLGIYWTCRTKLEVDTELSTRGDELTQTEPTWTLLNSMLDRTFEYSEGAIAAFVTGSTAASEIISRTVVESAVNLVYILVDNEDGIRLARYFSHYFDSELREIERWLKLAENMTGEAKEVHRSSALNKRAAINRLKDDESHKLVSPKVSQKRITRQVVG